MSQRFGGQWTEAKLDFVEKYAKAYLKVMRGESARRFTTYYVDGFAGSGHRYEPVSDQESLWEDLSDRESQEFRAGSALRALSLDPGFDQSGSLSPRNLTSLSFERL